MIKNLFMVIVLLLRYLNGVIKLIKLQFLIDSLILSVIFFSKSYAEKWSKKIFQINSTWSNNPWAYKVKDLNGEKVVGSCYVKMSFVV